MARACFAVAFGYLAMAALVMAGFSIAFVDPDIAFEPGTLTVTTNWLIYTILLSIAAAVLGGWVCRRIAKSRQPVIVLAALVFFIGLCSAFVNLAKPVAPFSAEELAAMPKMERLSHTRQPDWFAFAICLTAPLGILAAAGRRAGPRTASRGPD